MALINDTLYAKYMLERVGARILETAQAFVTYQIINDNVFIMDMFVDAGERSIGHGSALLSQLEEIAEKLQAKQIIGEVHVFDNNKETTLTCAIRRGFQIGGAQNGVITIVKKVRQ